MAAKKNHDWVAIEENALLDFQFAVIDAMAAAGVTKAELADRLGVSRARVSQMLDSEANPTIRVIARAMAVLGREVKFDVCDASTEAVDVADEQVEDNLEVEETFTFLRAADSGWEVQQRRSAPANENRYARYAGKVAA